MNSAPFQFQPRRALRAARALARDPDDLPQVFTIIEAFSGPTLSFIHRRMQASPRGARLLRDRPDIVALLGDREALGRMPEGSLGRAYLDFVTSENISAEGIREADRRGSLLDPKNDPSLVYVEERMRDTHDLWHAAIGYKGDVLGEAALLGFILGQVKNPGIALILGVAIYKLRGYPEARNVILDGYRRGKWADWLIDQEWETLLSLPVAEVRRRLNLEGPPVYAEVRSAELKASVAA